MLSARHMSGNLQHFALFGALMTAATGACTPATASDHLPPAQAAETCVAQAALLRLPALPEGRLSMQAMPSLAPAAKAFWVEPVQAFLARTEAALGQDCEVLTDGGRDRMFVAASACLSRSCRVLAQAFCKLEANKQVPGLLGARHLQFEVRPMSVAATAAIQGRALRLLARVLEPGTGVSEAVRVRSA